MASLPADSASGRLLLPAASDANVHLAVIACASLAVLLQAPQNVINISIPTVLDPSLAPAGKHLVHAYTGGQAGGTPVKRSGADERWVAGHYHSIGVHCMCACVSDVPSQSLCLSLAPFCRAAATQFYFPTPALGAALQPATSHLSCGRE